MGGWGLGCVGGWLEQVGLKLTQSPAKVEVGTELGNFFSTKFLISEKIQVSKNIGQQKFSVSESFCVIFFYLGYNKAAHRISAS